MTDIPVSNFATLHDKLSTYRADKRWVYRGQAQTDWALLPKAGRPPYKSASDEKVFKTWRRRAIEYVDKPPDSEWDWLAIAQHHGLATRLMDWTYNPLIAAFFAVREAGPGDAVVYALKLKYEVDPGKTSPMEYSGLAAFRPRGVAPRIVRQNGIFTIQGDPLTPLDQMTDAHQGLDRILVTESYREELLRELSYYGINSATLFPDLDGLSAFLNWTIESREYKGYDRS